MDNDDLPRGRVLSRREVIALLGASGAMLFVGCAGSTDLTGNDTSSTTRPWAAPGRRPSTPG
jgi:hypothetical protein